MEISLPIIWSGEQELMSDGMGPLALSCKLFLTVDLTILPVLPVCTFFDYVLTVLPVLARFARVARFLLFIDRFARPWSRSREQISTHVFFV